MSNLPRVTGDWLRGLADLVDKRIVEVIRCDLRPQGLILGIINPHKEKAVVTPPDEPT